MRFQAERPRLTASYACAQIPFPSCCVCLQDAVFVAAAEIAMPKEQDSAISEAEKR